MWCASNLQVIDLTWYWVGIRSYNANLLFLLDIYISFKVCAHHCWSLIRRLTAYLVLCMEIDFNVCRLVILVETQFFNFFHILVNFHLLDNLSIREAFIIYKFSIIRRPRLIVSIMGFSVFSFYLFASRSASTALRASTYWRSVDFFFKGPRTLSINKHTIPIKAKLFLRLSFLSYSLHSFFDSHFIYF